MRAPPFVIPFIQIIPLAAAAVVAVVAAAAAYDKDKKDNPAAVAVSVTEEIHNQTSFRLQYILFQRRFFVTRKRVCADRNRPGKEKTPQQLRRPDFCILHVIIR